MKQQQLRAGACVMDPPWPGQGVPYRTLSIRRILEFPLRELMAPNSHLYLWVPQGLVATGIKVAEQDSRRRYRPFNLFNKRKAQTT